MARVTKAEPPTPIASLAELEAAWERDAKQAIATIREFDPVSFLRLLARATADED